MSCVVCDVIDSSSKDYDFFLSALLNSATTEAAAKAIVSLQENMHCMQPKLLFSVRNFAKFEQLMARTKRAATESADKREAARAINVVAALLGILNVHLGREEIGYQELAVVHEFLPIHQTILSPMLALPGLAELQIRGINCINLILSKACILGISRLVKSNEQLWQFLVSSTPPPSRTPPTARSSTP